MKARRGAGAPARWSAAAPASTSNFGPGFDCLGMALDLHLRVTATRIAHGFEIRRSGEGSELAIDPHRDLVLTAFRHLCRVANEPVPSVALAIRSSIPLARGLGSSAAAIAAGLALANRWLHGRFGAEALLHEAIRLEGHPDNVAPALLGGFILTLPRSDGSVTALRLPPPRGIGITLVIPELRVSTEKARAMLPERIALRDAAANTARALGLLHALRERRFDLVADALRDVYHVPHRARLIRGFRRVEAAGGRAGAYGVTISGSGPTLLALHPPGFGPRVGNAMVRAFAAAGVRARALPGRPARGGALEAPAGARRRGRARRKEV